MKRKEKNSGITLIALVVTVIVLLILAGVSIGLVFDSNGLFAKANDAATKYNQAKQEEEDYLSSMMGELDKYNGLYGGGSSGTGNPTGTTTQTPEPTPTPFVGATDNTPQTASDGTWCIPKGFIESTESGATIKEGKVIQDAAGNEWVWVPCYVTGGVGQDVSSATEYKRTAFKGENITSAFTEDLDPTDSASIKKYGGFYIGRYEAGAETEVSSEDTTRKVLIQKSKKPYNYISQSNCVTKSNSFASDNNYDTDKVYTKIASSYAWDTALNFIQKTYQTYATNSTQGNYSDHKFSDTKGIINTGLTTPVCNIYDMGGNVWEYTSESLSGTNNPYVYRGGVYDGSASGGPAGYRGSNVGGARNGVSWRATLYMK